LFVGLKDYFRHFSLLFFLLQSYLNLHFKTKKAALLRQPL